MGATGNTAAGRNQLTSSEDRGIMLLADEPVNLDNAEIPCAAEHLHGQIGTSSRRNRNTVAEYNSATKAKGCTGQTVYSAAKIEEAVLLQVNDYFAIIRRDVDSAWKENARKRLRDSAKARQKAAEARLVKLQAHQGALKAEIMKSITGESTFDILIESTGEICYNDMSRISTDDVMLQYAMHIIHMS